MTTLSLAALLAVTLGPALGGGTAPGPSEPLVLGDARIDRDGAHFAGGFRVALVRVGRAGALRDAARGVPAARDGEVRVARGGGATEWWRLDARGLEHGVDLRERPAGSGQLVLELDAGEGTTVRALGPDALELRRDGAVARYAELVVLDARGERVPARLAAGAGRMIVEVDDRSARYPLVVDPLFAVIDTVRLAGTPGCTVASLGRVVSFSADGARAIAGAPDGWNCGFTAMNSGAAVIWARSAGGWAIEGELRGSGVARERFGSAVALSGDGQRAIVYGENIATVYVLSGGSWAPEAFLSGVPPQCSSVAMDGAGTRVVLGCEFATSPAPAVLVYDRSGGWARRSFPDVGTGTGHVVAISDDGTRILASSISAGNVRIFVESAGTFREEAVLAPAGADGAGDSASMSRDGRRVILGSTNTPRGRAWTFVRTGSTWMADGTLTVPAAADAWELAASVAISDDGTLAALGAPGEGSNIGSVRLFGRRGGMWVEDSILRAPTAEAGLRFGTSIALSADGSRVLSGAPGASGGGGAYESTLTPGASNGTACATGGSCLSGFCVEGVCCDERCGDGLDSECASCLRRETGVADGTCAPRTAGEVCNPSDGGACDPAETCNGTSRTCPPHRIAPAGATCRASAGDCDPAEVCDGVSTTCPGDVLLPSGARCGDDPLACSTPGMCSGTAPTCGGGGMPQPRGRICGPRDPLNPCDADDVCDGTGVCIEQSAPAATPCGILTPAGACDAPDHCEGTGPYCLDALLSGVECRAAMGACDVAEVCSGTSIACGPDVVLAASVVCRASTDAVCDPEESCDGVGATCPTDESSCAPDAGVTPDAGAEIDAGPGADAGTLDAGSSGPAAVTGCACRGGRSGSPAAVGFGALVMATALARRSRARPARRR